MDPNETLERIRALIAAATSKDDELDVGAACELLDLFSALDQWLVDGGFLPDAWSR